MKVLLTSWRGYRQHPFIKLLYLETSLSRFRWPAGELSQNVYPRNQHRKTKAQTVFRSVVGLLRQSFETSEKVTQRGILGETDGGSSHPRPVPNEVAMIPVCLYIRHSALPLPTVRLCAEPTIGSYPRTSSTQALVSAEYSFNLD